MNQNSQQNWNPEDFEVLHVELISLSEGSHVSAQQLQSSLQRHLEDFSQLLKQPRRNEASRKQVQTVLGTRYNVTAEFVNEAILMADDLDLDELLSSTYLQLATNMTDRLDCSALQSAFYLYYARRQYILDCLRLILIYTSDISIDEAIREKLSNFLTQVTSLRVVMEDGNYLASCKSAYPRQCFEHMRECEDHVVQLSAKEHAETYMQTASLEKSEIIKIQRSFGLQEHELVSQILFYLVFSGVVGWNDMQLTLSVLQQTEKCDTFIFHHLLYFWAFLECAAVATGDTRTRNELLNEIHVTLVGAEIEWKSGALSSAIRLIWLGLLNGRCKADDSMVTIIDYSKDIFDASVRALQEGAMVFLLNISIELFNLGDGIDIAGAQYLALFDSREKYLRNGLGVSNDFRNLVARAFELFVVSIISNLADVLKQLKINEEDAMMARSTTESNMDGDEVTGNNLETFFTFISCLYVGREEACLSFWSDSDSDLFGFLIWASQCSTPRMVTGFCNMLASLCSGEESSTTAHMFLSHESSQSHRLRRTYRITWQYIFESLNYYVTQLKSDTQIGTSVSRKPVGVSVASGLDSDTVLVLHSYLRLIRRAAKFNPIGRKSLQETEKVTEVFFDLLGCDIPSDLKASLFKCIAVFGSGKDEVLRSHIWISMDQFMNGERGASRSRVLPSTTENLTSTQRTQTQMFEIVLQSFEETDGFIDLLTALVSMPKDVDGLCKGLPFPSTLGNASRKQGIQPYTEFVFRRVFESLSPTVLPDSERRLALQLQCLDFGLRCCESFNPELISDDRISQIGSLEQASNVHDYMQLHPVRDIIDIFGNHAAAEKLFDIIRLYHEEENPQSLEKSVTNKALELLDYVLSLEHFYVDALLPTFQRSEGNRQLRKHNPKLSQAVSASLAQSPQVIVHIALNMSSEQTSTAYRATKLFLTVAQSRKFQTAAGSANGTAQSRNRLFELLMSDENSRRIIFGLINQMDTQRDYQSDEKFSHHEVMRSIVTMLADILDAQGNTPNVAHFLLGFVIANDGRLAPSHERGGILSGVSLLHTLMQIILGFAEEQGLSSSMDHDEAALVDDCFSIVRRLCSNELSHRFMMEMFAEDEFIMTLLSQEVVLSSMSSWAAEVQNLKDNAAADLRSFLTCFLSRRSSLFECASIELRHLQRSGSTSIIDRYLDILVGTGLDGSAEGFSMRILNFVEFLDLDVVINAPFPLLQLLKDMPFAAYEKNPISKSDLYDIESIVAALKLGRQGLLSTASADRKLEETISSEQKSITQYFLRENTSRLLLESRMKCCRATKQLLVVIMEDSETHSRPFRWPLIFETLQSIEPRLIAYCSEDEAIAKELASLCVLIIAQIDRAEVWNSATFPVVSDRLHILFQSCLRASQGPSNSANFRLDLYTVIYHYLHIFETTGKAATSSVCRSIGDRFLDTLCNDAVHGDEYCKIMSLVLLTFVNNISKDTEGRSEYVMEFMVRQNFIRVVIESLKQVHGDFVAASSAPEAIAYEMTTFQAKCGLLLSVSQTHTGANYLVKSGLFTTLQVCQFLKMDPELGFSFTKSTEDALNVFYQLWEPMLRLLLSCLQRVGPYNKHAIEQAKQFLASVNNTLGAMIRLHALKKLERTPLESTSAEVTDLVVVLFSLVNSAREESK